MHARIDAARIRNAPSARTGFSMVEMMTVIVILGLIATIVSVNWKAILPKSNLHAAVRNLASTLQTARTEAISRNAEYRIQYDLEHQRFRVLSPFAADGRPALTEEDRLPLAWNNLPSAIKFARITIDGVDFAQGMCYVRFDPLGAASGHQISLVQAPENNVYTIEVQGLTGLIDYHEGPFVRLAAKDADFR